MLDADLLPDQGPAKSEPIAHLATALLLFLLNDGRIVFGAAAAWALLALQAPAAANRWLATWLFPAYATLVMLAGATLFVTLQPPAQAFFGEAPDNSRPGFAERIPPQASVYWADSAAQVWFALGRRSYYSVRQSGGVLFSRPAALEMRRRADLLAGLGGRDSVWPYGGPTPSPRPAAELRSGLIALCRDEILDFAVLATSFADLQAATWHEEASGTDWFLYDCRTLRRSFPSAGKA